MKRVAGMSCTTENKKKEVLQADLEQNVNLCLHNSFCKNREQKINLDLSARNSVDMLQKVLEDSEMCDSEQDAME